LRPSPRRSGWFYVRIQTYLPAADAPCLECAWGEGDYHNLEQVHPCSGGVAATAATNAPASLGAWAAAMQAMECGRVLAGEVDRAEAGRQVLVDASNYRQHVTAYRRNDACRFDHCMFRLEALRGTPQGITFGQALDLAAGTPSAPRLAVEGLSFVRKLLCQECGRTRSVVRLSGRLRPGQKVCRRCGGPMAPIGFEMTPDLGADDGGAALRGRSLGALGFRAGDIFSLDADRAARRRFVIGGDSL